MAKTRTTYETISEALRDAIASTDKSFKAMERETGVSRQSLMKFAAGEQSLRLDAADKLAAYFRLQIGRPCK